MPSDSAILAWSQSCRSICSVAGDSRGSMPCLALNSLGHVVDQAVVPVDAAQVHVAVGGQHLEVGGRVADDRHVERAAAQVVDQRQVRLVARRRRRPARRGARHRSAWRRWAR